MDAVVVVHDEVPDFTARLLAGLAQSQPVDVVREALRHALPWATFLPESDLDQLLAELVNVAQGAAAPHNFSPVAVLLTQWRHTAEVYADPALLEILSRDPEGDLGEVVPPLRKSGHPEWMAENQGEAAPNPIRAGTSPCLSGCSPTWKESCLLG